MTSVGLREIDEFLQARAELGRKVERIGKPERFLQDAFETPVLVRVRILRTRKTLSHDNHPEQRRAKPPHPAIAPSTLSIS